MKGLLKMRSEIAAKIGVLNAQIENTNSTHIKDFNSVKSTDTQI